MWQICLHICDIHDLPIYYFYRNNLHFLKLKQMNNSIVININKNVECCFHANTLCDIEDKSTDCVLYVQLKEGTLFASLLLNYFIRGVFYKREKNEFDKKK